MSEILTQSELCEWLKISPMTAYRWRQEGMPHLGSGRRVRYVKEDVLLWLKNSEKNS